MNALTTGLAQENETLKESIAEVTRELRVRDVVYPRLIDSGRLTAGEAQRRAKALRTALYYLTSLYETRHAAEHTTGERV